MNIFSRFAGQTVSARTAVLMFLAALTPALWGVTIPLSRFVFRGGLLGWEKGIFEWVSVPSEAKVVLIAGYVFVIAATLTIFMATLLVSRTTYAETLERRLGRFSLANLAFAMGTLGSVGAIGLALMYTHHPFSAYAVFALGALICTVVGILVTFRIKQPESYRPAIALLPLLIGFAPLCYALLLTPFQVPNEFLALPEETVLESGTPIDNINFINARSFEGLVIPDPRLKQTGLPASSIEISLPQGIDRSVIESLERESPERFWYDRTNAQLEIHGPLKWDEFRYLSLFVQGADIKRLATKFATDSVTDRVLASKKYGNEELAFLGANKPELERQLVLGRFFYHHVFLFLPSLAGVLDGVVIFASQYGRGLTILFAEVLKLTPENLRFNGYLALLYLGYPLYLAILLLVATRLGLSRWGVIFVGAIALVGYITSDIETIRLGVGLVPWRHFFDVVVLFCLYLYARRPALVTGLMLVAITGFSVYWSREMGFFLAIAVNFGLVVHTAISRQIRQWLLVGACVFASMLGYWLGDPKAPTHPDAALLGINTPTLAAGFIPLLAGAALLAGAIWWIRRPSNQPQAGTKHADWVFLGGSLAYIAICGIYLLWYPRPHHLAPVMPVIGLAMAVAYRYYFHHAKVSGIKVAATSIVLVLCALILLGALRSLELRQEARIFRSHVVHEWNLPNGRITSTGQPELIRESVDLIRKHELRSSANILSPWEVVLLPFAGKYKAGPFLVSFDSLFSDKEVKQLAEHLVSSPDRALFVDSRIIHGQYESPLSEHAYMENRIFASTLRVDAHATLRVVFEAVRPCYDLAEEGRLISVYMRKPTAKWMGEACDATAK